MNWQTDTEGLTLQGASGGGKTTVARALQDLYPGPSICFDIDEEPGLGEVVHSVPELREQLLAGATEIVVRPGEFEVEEPDLFPEVVEYLMQVGNHLRGTDDQMQFIMGECQDLQSEWVEVVMKRFRKRRIKPIAETQDPFSLSTRVRTQAAYQAWVSPPKNKQVESLETTSWPTDLLTALKKHECLVFGEGWEPLDRFFVEKDYAHA